MAVCPVCGVSATSEDAIREASESFTHELGEKLLRPFLSGENVTVIRDEAPSPSPRFFLKEAGS
jgi:hypothetical protein